MPAGMKYWSFDKLSEYCHAPAGTVAGKWSRGLASKLGDCPLAVEWIGSARHAIPQHKFVPGSPQRA
jgi:hypothetical protein